VASPRIIKIFLTFSQVRTPIRLPVPSGIFNLSFVLTELTSKLLNNEDLSPAQVQTAVETLTSPSQSPEAKAEFLIALADKGETTGEIAAFVEELRKKSVPLPPLANVDREQVTDLCGTGGDHQNTFNISTTVSFVVAAAGVPVAKHGNRAITSQCGSADVLEALGIRTDLPPRDNVALLEEVGFCFFFAQRYHPAFKEIAPARKLCAERKRKTIFNFLGPLLNPIRPGCQLIGVPHPALCQKIAAVLQKIGTRRAMVVSGAFAGDGTSGYLDELSILGQNQIAEFYHDRGFHTSTLETSGFPISRARPHDLLGGNAQENALTLEEILQGKLAGPKTDAVLLNSAAALFVAGKSSNLQTGWDLAAELISTGKAYAKLQQIRSAHGAKSTHST
jgi:anthranilate phosphoribosyltransferase